MPELPEVETVRRGLKPVLEGHVLKHLTVRRADLRVPFPTRFAERLMGRQMLALKRRAKYLLLEFTGGETLIMHLGMSGRFTVHSAGGAAKPGRFHNRAEEDGGGQGKHDHVVFETDDGTRVVFTDHRRFGLMTLSQTANIESELGRIGPEPLDDAFTAVVLTKSLKGKKTPIKSALLDQRVVAGLGNIYVCEALFRAGISPKRLAASVKAYPIARLVDTIKSVLNEAIEAGGSTLRDYAQADGELGYFQHHFAVYGREGEPCGTKGCKGRIKRIVQAGRSTFYCPSCQR